MWCSIIKLKENGIKMFILGIIVFVITVILAFYWFFTIRECRKGNYNGFVYGIPLTAVGIVIYLIAAAQMYRGQWW